MNDVFYVEQGKQMSTTQKVKKVIPTEREECIAFWDYAQRVLKLGCSIFHVVNEGKRTYATANALKAIGFTKGVLDYVILVPNKTYHGLFIDMKRQNARTKKKDVAQEAFIANANKRGYYATYAYGCDDAIKIYTDYVNDRM